tara:strand:- start:9787 stop:11922 length:2136 start_codon:yes stop_codon:yes gene_type:complete
MFLVIDIKKITCLFAIFFSVFATAQVDEEIYNSKTKVIRKAGDKAFKNGDFFGSLSYYKKFLKDNDELIAKGGFLSGRYQVLKLKYQYKMANALRLSRDYHKAEKVYSAVFEEKPDKYPKAQFYLAHMQLMNGKYKKAKENFLAFKKVYRDAADSGIYRSWVKLYVASCDAAPVVLEDTLDVRIYHPDTSINKAHVELSPLPLNDSMLLYSSLRSDSIVYVNAEDSNSVVPHRKFYVAQKMNDSTWVMQNEYAEGWFNFEDTENGNGCFNEDSSRFYFSRGIRNIKGKLVFHLYYADKEEDEKGWMEPVKMNEEINVKGFHSTQPTLGWYFQKDVPVLYFISNRIEGGRGGWDIWYSEFNPKKELWKKPKNGGSKLNTKLDEFSPNYNIDNKTLHFSSAGWPGLGGLDVFKTIGELKDWTVPKNIGFPINTSVDELYYSLTKNGDEGYFVSNRVGSVSLKNPTCCDDIYNFKELHYIHIGVQGKMFEIVENKDLIDTVPSKFVTLSLVLLDDSIEGGEMVIKSVLPEDSGDYFFKLEKGKEYNLQANGENYFNQSFEISTEGIVESDTIIKNFYMKKFSVQPIVVKNIYYEYDKFALLDSSKTVIDTTMFKILMDNPDIVIEIGSHTDAIGSDAYNDKLSQKRAQSVVDYLIGKGIARKRLQAKGYGEKEPIAPNKNADGSDNPEGRQMNRRTEFRIIGKIEGISEIIYKK